MDVDYSLPPNCKKKYYIGSNYINVPRKDTEVENFLKDGMSKLVTLTLVEMTLELTKLVSYLILR